VLVQVLVSKQTQC